MSQIKQICSKCYSEKLLVNVVGTATYSLDVDAEGNVTPVVIEESNAAADFATFTCPECGEVHTIDQLKQGMQSTVSGKYYPVEELVSAEGENGETIICTQAEFDSLTAPSIDEMSEEQVKAHAKSQQEQIEALQAQMAQIMAQMQQGGAPAQTPVPTPAPAPTPTPEPQAQAPVQTPAIETNLAAPSATTPAVEIPAQAPIEVINVEGSEEFLTDDSAAFGNDAPF